VIVIKKFWGTSNMIISLKRLTPKSSNFVHR